MDIAQCLYIHLKIFQILTIVNNHSRQKFKVIMFIWLFHSLLFHFLADKFGFTLVLWVCTYYRLQYGIFIHVSILCWHGGAVVSNVVSQQEDSGFQILIFFAESACSVHACVDTGLIPQTKEMRPGYRWGTLHCLCEWFPVSIRLFWRQLGCSIKSSLRSTWFF